MSRTPPLLAFHNDPAIRTTYMERVRAHAAADQIVQGYGYWMDGKGCAVGCTLHSDDHFAGEDELGVPAVVFFLEDAIFEALPKELARSWPLRFLEAIPLGADLSGVTDQFLAWMMDDPTFGLAYTAREQDTKDLAAEVGRRLRSGDGVTGERAEAWEVWEAWAALEALEAWEGWEEREAFVEASSNTLLEYLAAAPVAERDDK